MLSFNYEIDDVNVQLIVMREESCYDHARFSLNLSIKGVKTTWIFYDVMNGLFIYLIGLKHKVISKILNCNCYSEGYNIYAPNRWFSCMQITDKNLRITNSDNCLDLDVNIMMKPLLQYAEFLLGFYSVLPVHYVLSNVNIPIDIITYIKKLLAIEIANVLYNVCKLHDESITCFNNLYPKILTFTPCNHDVYAKG